MDPATHTLWRDDARVALTNKAFEILRVLVDRAGHVVTKDAILGAVWPDTYVHPDNVKVLIGEIRRALVTRPQRSFDCHGFAPLKVAQIHFCPWRRIQIRASSTKSVTKCCNATRQEFKPAETMSCQRFDIDREETIARAVAATSESPRLFQRTKCNFENRCRKFVTSLATDCDARAPDSASAM